MCTAITYRTQAHYFGRNLDLERSYGERVVVTPRHFPLPMRCMPPLEEHYAIIGIAAVADGFPLYFDATNEMGLSIAGLNFPGYAVYHPYAAAQDNITPFELIPWLLGTCRNVAEVRRKLIKTNLVDIPFSDSLPLSPLHWLIADRETALVVESVAQGLRMYYNPVGVLTNSPPFDYHLTNLNNYMSLHEGQPDNRLGGELSPYSLGMGALGLPGDFSSASRFVKAAFVKKNSRCEGDETAEIRQFFHLLASVAMPRGCVLAANGDYEYTRYSCCCHTDTGVYHYTTYEDSTVRSVGLWDTDPDGDSLRLSAPVK